MHGPQRRGVIDTRRRPTIELGIRGERVSSGDHIAFLWETPEEFEEAVGFLELAFDSKGHGVLFGHPEANDRVRAILAVHGYDAAVLQQEGRLTILGGASGGDEMLGGIASAFQRALDGGATLIRLLGNIGWGRANWPVEDEILAFEAKVTEAAKDFPAVVLCLYDMRSLSGRIIVHGAIETHPLTICRNVLRENPYHVPIKQFLGDLLR